MKDFFFEIKDWMEVWPLLIPLIVLMVWPKQPAYMKPVIIYIWVALAINLLADLSWKLKAHYHFPIWYQTNSYFYNMHSIVRFALFSWFFMRLKQPFLSGIKVLLIVLFGLFVLVNFIFFEPFVNFWFDNGKFNSKFSNNLLSVESIFLLLFCLQYFFYLIKQDEPAYTKLPSFWVVTGLSIYVVTGFPIYLFYNASFWQNQFFVINIWIVLKVAFLIFCVFIATGFTRAST